MKRKCIQETFVMILCALFFCACSGCALPSDFSSVSVTTKEEQLTKTTSTTVKSSARTGKAEPSAMNTSEIAIRVVDKSTVPIANLRVSMRHLTGDKYNYTPDLAFTDADGTAYGRAVAKTYELTVEDVEGDVVFNKITAVLEVEKGKWSMWFRGPTNFLHTENDGCKIPLCLGLRWGKRLYQTHTSSCMSAILKQMKGGRLLARK